MVGELDVGRVPVDERAVDVGVQRRAVGGGEAAEVRGVEPDVPLDEGLSEGEARPVAARLDVQDAALVVGVELGEELAGGIDPEACGDGLGPAVDDDVAVRRGSAPPEGR
ncbi:hypothetical protein [Motilibacter rhizosphaerae]|uniref:hypothetical protein n=1 Tax=Motilibacter rhizosphaerae TaxID=598652 RepID=UPI00102B9FD1|nr:hypothetical protein [Motilibacter rhizosphaerae]